jgi:hypothetical protein
MLLLRTQPTIGGEVPAYAEREPPGVCAPHLRGDLNPPVEANALLSLGPHHIAA